MKPSIKIMLGGEVARQTDSPTSLSRVHNKRGMYLLRDAIGYQSRVNSMDSTSFGTSQRKDESPGSHLMTNTSLSRRKSKPILKMKVDKTDSSYCLNANSPIISATANRAVNLTTSSNRLNIGDQTNQAYPSITLTNWRKGELEVTNKTRFQRIHKRQSTLCTQTSKRMLLHSRSNESLLETQSKLRTLLKGIAPIPPTAPFRTRAAESPILQNNPPFSLSCLDPSPAKQAIPSPHRSDDSGPPKLDKDRQSRQDFITANRRALQHTNPVKSQKLLQTYLSSPIFKIPAETPLFETPAAAVANVSATVPIADSLKLSRSTTGVRGKQSRNSEKKKAADIPVSQMLSSFLTNLSRGMERKHAESRADKLDFLGTHFRERLDKVTDGLEGLVRAYRETASAGEVMFSESVAAVCHPTSQIRWMLLDNSLKKFNPFFNKSFIENCFYYQSVPSIKSYKPPPPPPLQSQPTLVRQGSQSSSNVSRVSPVISKFLTRQKQGPVFYHPKELTDDTLVDASVHRCANKYFVQENSLLLRPDKMVMEMEEVYVKLRELLYHKKIEPVKALRAELQNRADKVLKFSRPVVDRFIYDPNNKLPTSHETLVHYMEEFKDIRGSMADALLKKKTAVVEGGGDRFIMLREIDTQLYLLQSDTKKTLVSLNSQLAKPLIQEPPKQRTSPSEPSVAPRC